MATPTQARYLCKRLELKIKVPWAPNPGHIDVRYPPIETSCYNQEDGSYRISKDDPRGMSFIAFDLVMHVVSAYTKAIEGPDDTKGQYTLVYFLQGLTRLFAALNAANADPESIKRAFEANGDIAELLRRALDAKMWDFVQTHGFGSFTWVPDAAMLDLCDLRKYGMTL